MLMITITQFTDYSPTQNRKQFHKKDSGSRGENTQFESSIGNYKLRNNNSVEMSIDHLACPWSRSWSVETLADLDRDSRGGAYSLDNRTGTKLVLVGRRRGWSKCQRLKAAEYVPYGDCQ